jgi:hypothetical protein
VTRRFPALAAGLAITLALALPTGAAAADPAESWLLYLKDGRVLRGEVVDRDATTLTVVVAKTGEKVVFEEALLRRAEGPPLPPRCQAGDGRAVTAALKDGRTVAGALVRRCEGAFTLAPAGGEPVRVREDEVASLGGEPGAALPEPPRPPPLPWRTDVARTRLLASPTGLGPAQGEILVGTALQQLSVEAGLADFLSLSAGTTPVVAYGRRIGSNGTAALTASGSWRWLHGRAGVQGAFSSHGLTAAYLFGAVTAGGPDLQLTAYAGPPLPGSALIGEFRDRILALGGTWRVTSWAALATEHWVALDGKADSAHALAARLLREPLAVEVGGLYATGTGKVLPWIGLSWRAWRFE